MNIADFRAVRYPIWARIATIFLVSVIPLVAFLVVHYYSMVGHNRADREAAIAAAARQAALDIAREVDNATDILAATSQFKCVREHDTTETNARLLGLLPRFAGVDNLAVYDMTGRNTGSALRPSFANSLRVERERWFREARAGHTAVEGPVRSPITGWQALLVAAPLIDHEGRQSGVVTAEISVGAVRGLLDDETGSHGDVSLAAVDATGRVIADTAERVAVGEALFSDARARSLRTARGGAFVSDSEELGFVEPVPGSSIRVVATEPMRVVMRSAAAFRRDYLLAIAAALLVSATLTYSVSASLLRRLRALGEAVVAVEHGNFDVAVPEQGSDELNAIVVAFNRMLERRAYAEEELRRSERFLASVLEGITEGLAVIDSDFNIISANSTYCFHVRRPYSEVLGRKCYEVSHDSETPCWKVEDGISCECPVRKAFVSGVTEKATHVHRNADGHPVYVEVVGFPMKDEAGRVVSVIELVQDVTDRVTLQREVEQAKERYEKLYNDAPDMMYSVDENGRIVIYNAAFRRALGYDDAELRGRSFFDLVAPDARAMCASRFERLKAEGEYEGDLVLQAKDGRRIPVHVRSRAVFDEAGRFVMSDSIMRDLTEQKALEAQIAQSQKMEAVGQLAGSVAHDFNNYLTAIIGYASLLRERLADDPEASEEIGVVLSTAERAAELTRSLLDFSRAGSGRMARIDLNSFLVNHAQLIERFAGENVRVEFDLCEGEAAITANENRLAQVVVNLVTNARDAMPDGGTLRLGTRLAALDPEYVQRLGLERSERYVCLTVADTGHGMSEETKRRIFEPFYTTKQRGKGSGLGLAIVYSTVKALGGFIEVDSKLGEGTIFRIYLPESPGESAVSADVASEKVEVPRGRGERILLVEDDQNVQRFLKGVLEAAGYEVHAFGSGEAALAWLEANGASADAGVFDIMLPGMSGVETLSRIRESQPGFRALFVTGYPGDSLFRASTVEDVPVLEKPTKPADLLSALRDVLDAGPEG